ncbi:MAG: amidohydrolase family protein [Pseudohongiellaceae bacterium]
MPTSLNARLTPILTQALTLLLLLPLAASAQPATLFENAPVITGDGRLLVDADLLVRGDTLIDVGDAASFSLPADTTRVDLSGRFIMPALIDAHAHLGYQSPDGWGADYYSRENLLGNLRQYAWYGFAAVLSAGSDPEDLALSLQAEQAAAVAAGADDSLAASARFLFAAGMGPPGQGPNDAFLEETAVVSARTGMTILRAVDSPVAAIRQVREVARKNIPFIKIWVDDRGGSQDKLPPDLYLPLLAEAMRQRIDVFVHQQYPADMPPLIEGGASGFLHGRLGPELGPDIAAAMARERVFLVPNLGLGELRREAIGRDPFLQPVLPEPVAARLAATGGGRLAAPPPDPARDAPLETSLRHLQEAGASIVLGTDAGALPDHPFGYAGHRELEIFVRLGMSPMQALVAATGAAAAELKQSDLGVLEPGRRASFVVLAADPLVDIRNTRRIESVYLNGRAIDRDVIARSLRGAR